MSRTIRICALLLAGCGQSNTDGNIEVTGWLDSELIDATAAEALSASQEVTLSLCGRPGAAPGLEQITATNERSSASVTVDVTAAGTFVAELDVLLDDPVTVAYVDGTLVVDDVQIVVAAQAAFPALGSPPTLHGPDAHGEVVVQLSFAAPLDQERIVVANPSNHHVTELTRLDPSTAAGHIPAHSGDGLLLYAATEGAVSVTHHLAVP